MALLDQVYLEMIQYNSGDARRIQHFVKVHSFARIIGIGEGLEGKALEILEVAAYVHDIGIKRAEAEYGRSDGHLQEQLGPDEARKMLKRIGYDEQIIERVAYLVGHHHTYTAIEEMDYQILVEADFLVNLFEDQASQAAIASVRKKVFKTPTGLKILDWIYA